VFLGCINGSERVPRMWKMKEVVVADLTDPMKILITCGIKCIEMFKYQSYGCATKFRQRNSEKRSELLPSDWILHHDNVPAYMMLSVRPFLAQKSINEMKHTPSSSDLALNGFWQFPKIKSVLKGQKFLEY
jgi:hypothetical protein